MERQNRQAVAADPLKTQALVIGAGPVGLYQAFQLGLLGISCHITDVLTHVGGQCAELYPNKPIYDIPGLPRCTGQELVDRLIQQLTPFDIPMHLGQQVTRVSPRPEGSFEIHTSAGQVFHSKTVFIAAGVGAFLPRTLALDGLQQLKGVTQAGDALDICHSSPHVVIAGSDEHIMDVLSHWLARPTASLSLLHRRDKLDLNPDHQLKVDQLLQTGRLKWVVGQAIGHRAENGQLKALQIAPPEGEVFDLPCDVLVQCLGLSPKLGPIAEWGLHMARRRLQVNTENFGTSVSGIYAVGDINHYPGKRKLIACGFHEATLAAYGAAERLTGAPRSEEHTSELQSH